MKVNNKESGRSMIEMLEKVKQPLNAVLRRQAQVFRCCQSALAPRSNTENQVTEAPLGARQRQCALAQLGRSMIEMLGVLAIIGVLSVGGIAGYSKAMMRIRINKTIDEVTQISQGIRTLFSAQKNYIGLNNEVLRKAHIAPENMWQQNTGDGYSISPLYLENPFGGEVIVDGNVINGANSKYFGIIMNGLPQEACIEISTMDWKNEFDNIMVYGININKTSDGYGTLYEDEGKEIIWVAADYFVQQRKMMGFDSAISGCNYQDDNNLFWIFK